MTTEKQSTWLDTFKREAGIRRCIILHGNTLDVYENGGKYEPIQNVIIAALQSKGFTHIVLWDKFSGAQNISLRHWEELQRQMFSTSDDSKKQTGTRYAVDDEEPQHTNDDNAGQTPPNINDFLPVVHYHLTHQNEVRIAFILDWSQYLFGTNASLCESERQQLMMLSKAINNSPLVFDRLSEIGEPANMVVLLTAKLGSIPPIYYQGNACVKDIVIPSPSRKERESFLQKECHKFNLLPVPYEVDKAGKHIFDCRSFNDFIDATDGLSIRDLLQLAKLSMQHKTKLSFENLLYLYRYGEQKSPWEELSKDKLKDIVEILKERVKGQDGAVKKVAQVIIRAFTGLSGVQHNKKQCTPKGTLFFSGPTGVGKTELAKALAEFLFGDEEACVRFDMSEFNHEHSDQRLIGAPPGYVGYEEGGQLTNAVKKRPFAVLLFDEIEKAHHRILDKFLQILEDGRLTDGKGDTILFSETIIIFTSNIGASEVKLENAHGGFRDFETIKNEFILKVKEHITKKMKRPELLNRIGDNIVPFNFITGDDFLLEIAKAKLKPIREILKEKHAIIDLEFNDECEALKSVIERLDKSMGGRGVGNEIVQTLLDPLAGFLFKLGDEKRGKTIVVHGTAPFDESAFVLQ